MCPCLAREKEPRLLPEEGSGGGNDYGWAVARNDRCSMEDAIHVQDDVAGFRLFIVYDGHAGEQAVSVVKGILPNIVAFHLQKETDVKRALSEAFKAVDAELTKSLLDTAGNAGTKFSSGTVACMALVKGKELWLANLGDC